MKQARGVLILAVSSVLLMVSVGSASADLFTYGNPAFCSPKEPVWDFGLSKLPAVPEAPESFKALGHGAVTVHGGWSRVMPRPVPFGYGFSEHAYSGGGVRLDWTVTAQLWTIDRHGTALQEVDREKLFIGNLSAANQPHIAVDPPESRRGFYRFDMQIADKSGAKIGSYGAYFRVVRPFWRPKLRLTRDVVRPGQRLLIRVENHGSETITYGESFRVQRYEEGAWVEGLDLRRRRWFLWLGFLQPGGAGRCSALVLPTDTPPGRYRIVKSVRTERWPKGREITLAAPFEVLGSGATIEY
jgi:hypothetical protein